MGTPQSNHSTAKLMVDIIFRSSTNMRHILVVNYNVFEEYNNNDKYLNLFGSVRHFHCRVVVEKVSSQSVT
jgi:hypothetical protein